MKKLETNILEKVYSKLSEIRKESINELLNENEKNRLPYPNQQFVMENEDIFNLLMGSNFHEFKKILVRALPVGDTQIITFDGVDATGKGTLSRLLTELLNGLNISAIRVNVPDYSIESGKILKNCLVKEYTPEELYSNSFEFANHFAINRLHVKQNIKKNKEPEFIIFDRWVNSSIAFTLAKIISLYLSEMKLPIKIVNGNWLNDQLEHRTPLAMKLFEATEYIYNTEYEAMDNFKPDIEFITASNVELISERIKQRRAKDLNEEINDTQDKATNQPDAHEDNMGLIWLTQKIYVEVLSKKLIDTKVKRSKIIDTSAEDELLSLIRIINTLLSYQSRKGITIKPEKYII